MRYIMLGLFTLAPDVVGITIFGYYALVDWDALQKAYSYFEKVTQQQASLETLFIAEAQQNIHRINLFADGVWALLSAMLASIGLHGICTISRRSRG